MAIKLKVIKYTIQGDKVVLETSSTCPINDHCNTKLLLDFCDCVPIEDFCKYVEITLCVCNGCDKPIKQQVPLIYCGKKMLGYQLARYVNTHIAKGFHGGVALACGYNGDLHEMFCLNTCVESPIPFCCNEKEPDRKSVE